jgi:hypothetical protein
MFTQEVNVDAMFRATALMFGDQAAMILAKLADTIDQAQQAAYELGVLKGQENLEAACDASFDSGWEASGIASTEAHSTQAWEDGYLDGVHDARANPTLADEMVQNIINDRADECFEALEDADFDEATSGWMHGEYRR